MNLVRFESPESNNVQQDWRINCKPTDVSFDRRFSYAFANRRRTAAPNSADFAVPVLPLILRENSPLIRERATRRTTGPSVDVYHGVTVRTPPPPIFLLVGCSR